MAQLTEGPTSHPFLVGDRLYLRPVERMDLAWIRKWANDPQIRRLTGEVRPMTAVAADRFYDKVQKDEDRVWAGRHPAPWLLLRP